MKVIFFGTPEFVVPIPQALLEAEGCKLTAVVTRPESPIKAWAQNHKLPVIDSASMDRIIEQVQILEPQVGVLAAYGKIIPQELINLFPKGILVIHPSLLPKYRGASPVQAAILAGESQTGVTIIKMDEKMDHGPIISQFTEPIKPDDTAETLYQKLFSKAAEALLTILPAWVEGQIKPRKQNHPKATYTKILKREDGYIDLENPPSPELLQRMIRAYHPWPGVWSKFKVKSEKFKVVKFLPEQKIQPEGRKPMNIRDFLNGYPKAKDWIVNLYGPI